MSLTARIPQLRLALAPRQRSLLLLLLLLAERWLRSCLGGAPQVLKLALAGKSVVVAKRAAEGVASSAKRARDQLAIARALASDAASAAGLARASKLDPTLEARLALVRAFGRTAMSDATKATQQNLAAKRVAYCANQLHQRNTIGILRRGVPEASRAV